MDDPSEETRVTASAVIEGGEMRPFGSNLFAVVRPLGPLELVTWVALVDGEMHVVEAAIGERSIVSEEAVLRQRAAKLKKRLRSTDYKIPESDLLGIVSSLGLARASDVVPRRRHRRIASVERSPALIKRLDSEDDAALVPYANDALLVATLLKRGDRAPARTLGEVRAISVRSAQGRISRARRLGLLTPVPHGVIGGELTEKALDITRAALALAKSGQMDDKEGNSDG